MEKQVWQSKHFKSIFRTVYTTSVALLTIALLIMFFAFQKMSVSYLDSVMTRFMENVYSRISHQILSSQNHSLNVSTSYNGMVLFSTQPALQSEKFHAAKDIDYLISAYTDIHSVLFYNSNADRLYMFGRDHLSCNGSTFYDREVMDMIHSSTSFSSKFVPRVIRDSPYTSTTSSVLTSVHHIGYDHYVVVNLDTNQVFSALQDNHSVYSENSAHYFVVYDHNQIIYDSGNADGLSSHGDLILEQLADHSWKDHFSANIQRDKYHFQVMDVPSANLQMVTVIRQFDITGGFYGYVILLLCILAASGIIAALVNFRVSSRLYSPIVRIKHALSASDTPAASEPSPEDEIDEIDDITRRITDRSIRLDSLFSYKKKSLSLSQEIFLKNQMLYNKYSESEFWEKAKQEELSYAPGDGFVLTLAQWFPKKPETGKDASDQNLLSFGLSNVVHELFDEKVNVRDLPLEQDGIAFLFCFRDEDAPVINQSVLSSIQKIFDQYFELNLSFFISPTFTSPRELFTSMQQLQELSGYQFFHSGSCILHTKDVDTHSLLSEVCEVPNTSDLEALIRSGDWPNCKEMMDAFFQELHRYNREAAGASASVFLSRLIAIFKRIEATCPAFPSLNYHQFYNQVSGVHTLSQAQNLIYDQIMEIIQVIGQEDHNSARIDAKDIQRYLETNYQDFTLSSKSAAETFHVSVPYLNRIFKQKTGDSISSYLKRYRLERAKELLLETNKPVAVIAQTVGFENTKYFYSLFKAEYGLSPNNYRTVERRTAESQE